jgi:hypothetical protein
LQTDQAPILDLPAGPAARGLAHGEALRSRIADKIERWRSVISGVYRCDPSDFLARFLAGANFRPAIERWSPGLLAEMSAIAVGAGQPAELIYALQLMDEEWWFAETAHEHCSSVAILPSRPGEPTRIGQTMDLPRWLDGSQAILRFPNEDGVQTLIITSAGMVGLMGVNGHGLAVCMNSLRRLTNSRAGLPVSCCVRRILTARGHDEAVRLTLETPHATAQNYLIADRSSATAVECSATRSIPTRARELPNRVFHTNHAFENDDERADLAPATPVDSLMRLASLRQRLGGLKRDVGLDDIKAAFGSQDDPKHPISKAPGASTKATTSRTFAAVIYELGDDITVNFCGGPPSEQAWSTFGLGPAGEAIAARHAPKAQ